ncbi:uncharacterized protein LOC127792050 isoform X2 [Diospyros lotus]|nr:uncharacterized protein LOC127792050 isoform X2 [Diospyros lotus]XP_052178316.1 uncharacterized protein LOC127792050 isoform X2 [Diospyros lotus]XP_052178317.1 uncharacterized protein LOC127792050 isoform X2 [Diospyros lotus]
MTLQVHTVNLLLETHGGARQKGGATWASPMASITIRNLLLYTTNENWQVVNLKEARDFSSDKKFIYVFKKLEWESLSVDLLPHPDMFADAHFASSQEGSTKKDDDGAKRVFFGGERFIEGISGQAYITIQRTELNSPLGLEVQLHITEAVCPALSEPGLRALLRFFTGLYVCLNRGDLNPNAQQRSTEAAGRSLVSIIVDHIFLCIKDAEFRLELLMQSLLFSRASVSDGENVKYLTHVKISGLFLRDTFSHPPCTLVQPSMQAASESFLHIPEFAKNFCPPIYPLEHQLWQLNGHPLVCIHSLQVQPSPAPPAFASQTVINCQPLMIHLQEESCLKIASLLADGIVVNPGTVLPDFSVNSLKLNLVGLDITVPLDMQNPMSPVADGSTNFQSSFSGARLHIEHLFFSESPSLELKLLNLEKDPACFCLWEDQPIDASQKKWTTGASLISLSLETCDDSTGLPVHLDSSSGLWRCVDLKDACIEVAMVTADGSPLKSVPPPGGLVRVGVASEQYLSNTSVEQLFFVLDLYAYFGRVSEKIAIIGKSSRLKKTKNELSDGKLMEKVPSDTAVSLAVRNLQLRFMESSSVDIQGMPLVQFLGDNLFVKVTHRTLGGAIAISSSLRWESVQVDCADTEGNVADGNGTLPNHTENGVLRAGNGCPQLRTVFWVQKRLKRLSNGSTPLVPFLDISMVHIVPFSAQDMECHSLSLSACVAGVRLGGGMNYAEALLHRFGILGPDGGPGEGLTKGLENLSAGPLSKLFKASPLTVNELQETMINGTSDENENVFLQLSTPDDVELSIELKDWLFALEGAQENIEVRSLYYNKDLQREERCWHTTFQSLRVKAKSNPGHVVNGKEKLLVPLKCPVELITVGVEGLQILKPKAQKHTVQDGLTLEGFKDIEVCGGVNLEARVVISEDDAHDEMIRWMVENLKFSVKDPIEAVVTKDELQHLVVLCKSEVDSMGRIAAGILRVLKLEKSIGQAAITQLSNLGSESFDKIFSQDKLSRATSLGSTGFSPPAALTAGSPRSTLVSTVAALEQVVLDSQAKCESLSTEFYSSEHSRQHLAEIKQLSQKLESMQSLLTRLRTQI